MVPLNSSSPKDEDTALTALLHAQSPAIPEDGFSARVVAALPPAAGARPARGLWLAYLGGAGTGTAFVLAHAGSWSNFTTGLHQLGDAITVLGTAFTDPWLGLAVILSIVSVVIVVPLLRRPVIPRAALPRG